MLYMYDFCDIHVAVNKHTTYYYYLPTALSKSDVNYETGPDSTLVCGAVASALILY